MSFMKVRNKFAQPPCPACGTSSDVSVCLLRLITRSPAHHVIRDGGQTQGACPFAVACHRVEEQEVAWRISSAQWGGRLWPMIASSNIQRITLRRVCDKRSQVYWHATPRLLLKIYHSGTFLRARARVINVCLASDTDSGSSCCPKDSKSNHVPKLSLNNCSSQNLPGV
jgi:hypothetical protein